jgi:hypothetical protein
MGFAMRIAHSVTGALGYNGLLFGPDIHIWRTGMYGLLAFGYTVLVVYEIFTKFGDSDPKGGDGPKDEGSAK